MIRDAAPGRPAPQHPLRLRDFRLLFLGRTVSTLGDAVVPAALAIAITRATGSSGALALVLGCAMVPRLLLLPFGGVAGDRLDPRRVALTTDLLRAATQLLVGLELLGARPDLTHIAIASAAGGLASAFAMPTASPLVRAAVPAEHRLRANALLGSATSAARLGGPALAGVLVYTAGPGWAFVADGVSFLLSAALLTRVRIAPARSGQASAEKRTLRRDLAEGWREVRARDWYWTSLVAHGVWNGASAVALTLGPLIAATRLGGDGVWVAVTQAGAVGLLLGSLAAGRLRPRRPVLVGNLALALFGLPLLALAVPAPAPVTVAAYGVAMAGLGFLNPVWETVVQREFPAQVLARVTSYDWLLSLAAAPLGYVLAPLAAGAWGSRVPLLAAAVLVTLVCAGTAAVPGVRRLGTQPEKPAPATVERPPVRVNS
ncbi:MULTISPECIES: MFS transporter [Kitasatospora]|uniref:MFS transporter n=1 Tax=Kitasatospora cathayae TaxID=3004092 RepID=A0ABY7PXV5_9ACTN|nr:MFS transporter [Kitasatospora sp. HUAS 3-15]WBP85263.1 MFS transporter [Kitasatospora sp. HUAS 3-15]